ncbi:TIR domain-containing protein [Pseudonocardiaceae bacterium YIM PH 21723]|nr:TIR domain-containing protein [Pseudonocardiaceae bacterium YIM PH 21723]
MSYAVADRALVKPLVNALKLDGFTVWIDYEQMAGGMPVVPQLADAVAQSAHMIVCLTDAYLRRDWTNAELHFSLTLDPAGKRVGTIPAILQPLTEDIPLYLKTLAICDLTDRENNYEKQYELATKMIRKRRSAREEAEVVQVCATPFGHVDQPEVAFFQAYRAYCELSRLLYRREIGAIPDQANFSLLSQHLLMRSSLPGEIRDAIATMEGYGRQVVPGYVNGPVFTAETIESPLRALATLTSWVFPDWQRPDEQIDIWDVLPPGEGDTRQLSGTDYLLSPPVLARTTLGPLYGARQAGDGKPMTIVLVDPPLEDYPAYQQHVRRFRQEPRADVGETKIGNRRCQFLTMPVIDGVSAAALVDKLGTLAPRAAFELVLGIAERLRGLHEAVPPVAHGDVAPANAFVGPLSTVTLCPGRGIGQSLAEDLAALGKFLAELLPGPVAQELAGCATAARACHVLRQATTGLPYAEGLREAYRVYTQGPPPPRSDAPHLVETDRFEIESEAAWPLGGSRVLVWEKDTDTLVVREGAETVWRDSHAVMVRRAAYGPGGRFAIGCWDGTLRSFTDGALSVATRMDGAIGDLCFVGDALIAGSWKQNLWRFEPDGKRRELLDVEAGVHRIAATDGRDRFAVADLSGGLSIYAGTRRIATLPAAGPVTDLAYAGSRLVLLNGETLTSLLFDGSTGATEDSPGAHRLLPGPAPAHCTLLIRTATQTETWLIDEADRHVRDQVFPAGRTPVHGCEIPGRFIVSGPGCGKGYWRDGKEQALWGNATSATLSHDGRLIAVSRPGVVELYADFG